MQQLRARPIGLESHRRSPAHQHVVERTNPAPHTLTISAQAISPHRPAPMSKPCTRVGSHRLAHGTARCRLTRAAVHLRIAAPQGGDQRKAAYVVLPVELVHDRCERAVLVRHLWRRRAAAERLADRMTKGLAARTQEPAGLSGTAVGGAEGGSAWRCSVWPMDGTVGTYWSVKIGERPLGGIRTATPAAAAQLLPLASWLTRG